MLVLKFEVDFNALISMNVNRVNQINYNVPFQLFNVFVLQKSFQVRIVRRDFFSYSWRSACRFAIVSLSCSASVWNRAFIR